MCVAGSQSLNRPPTDPDRAVLVTITLLKKNLNENQRILKISWFTFSNTHEEEKSDNGKSEYNCANYFEI